MAPFEPNTASFIGLSFRLGPPTWVRGGYVNKDATMARFVTSPGPGVLLAPEQKAVVETDARRGTQHRLTAPGHDPMPGYRQLARALI